VALVSFARLVLVSRFGKLVGMITKKANGTADHQKSKEVGRKICVTFPVYPAA